MLVKLSNISAWVHTNTRSHISRAKVENSKRPEVDEGPRVSRFKWFNNDQKTLFNYLQVIMSCTVIGTDIERPRIRIEKCLASCFDMMWSGLKQKMTFVMLDHNHVHPSIPIKMRT